MFDGGSAHPSAQGIESTAIDVVTAGGMSGDQGREFAERCDSSRLNCWLRTDSVTPAGARNRDGAAVFAKPLPARSSS
jgi:hypothetical protein